MTTRRRRKEDTPNDGPHRTWSVKSGWCIDGTHTGCRHTFTHVQQNATTVCPCTCHGNAPDAAP